MGPTALLPGSQYLQMGRHANLMPSSLVPADHPTRPVNMGGADLGARDAFLRASVDALDPSLEEHKVRGSSWYGPHPGSALSLFSFFLLVVVGSPTPPGRKRLSGPSDDGAGLRGLPVQRHRLLPALRSSASRDPQLPNRDMEKHDEATVLSDLRPHGSIVGAHVR
jgi:hypothetical protein